MTTSEIIQTAALIVTSAISLLKWRWEVSTQKNSTSSTSIALHNTPVGRFVRSFWVFAIGIGSSFGVVLISANSPLTSRSVAYCAIGSAMLGANMVWLVLARQQRLLCDIQCELRHMKQSNDLLTRKLTPHEEKRETFVD